MPACSLCRHAKPDAQVRPLLRVIDQSGGRTRDPFEGPLCDYCCAMAQQLGTPEHLWVLNQITAVQQRRLK